jgi:hypothetical protein
MFLDTTFEVDIGDMNEDLSFLGCDAVLGEWFLTFLRIVVPPSSWVSSPCGTA